MIFKADLLCLCVCLTFNLLNLNVKHDLLALQLLNISSGIHHFKTCFFFFLM